MKNLFSIYLVLFLFTACSSENETDKKTQLENLLKQQAEISSKIKTIKDELVASDTSGQNNSSTLVQVSTITVQPFNHYIEVQARVDGEEDVQVSAESMGNITAIFIKAGDRVTKGQVMATIDDKIIKQSVAELQTQLDLVTNLYNKQKALWDQKIGSEIQFIQAKTNKDALEKRMGAIQEQWEMTRIKSPIQGTVDAVHIKIGQTVSPGMPTIHVVNLSSLKVKGEIAESYINKVKKGNQVLIYFPDLNKEVKAKVDYSGGAINNMNRTFNVEVRLNSNEGNFHPNMIAVLKINDYTSPAAIIVPVKIIQSGSQGQYIFVASTENGKLVSKRQNVTAGISYNGYTEIKAGLKEGDRVITIGYADLVEGQEIII